MLRPLLVGSTGFLASVAICLAISHSATTEHDGISYFSLDDAAGNPARPALRDHRHAGCGPPIPRRGPRQPVGVADAVPVLFVALLRTPFNKGASSTERT
jgi:hypothetical protein